VTNIAFSPDGKLLAATETAVAGGENKGMLVTWEMPSGKEKMTIPNPGRKLFELASGRPIPFVPPSAGYLGHLFDGKQYLVSQGSVVQVRESQKGDMIREFAVHSTPFGVKNAVSSPDGKMVACSIGEAVKVWDVATGNEIASTKGHDQAVLAVSFSRSAKWIATASGDKTARIWNSKTGELVKKIAFADRAISVAFSPDERLLVVGTVGKTSSISFCDTSTGKEALTLKPQLNGAKRLVFNSAGTLFANTGGAFVQVWELSAAPEKAK
jgi:WD40 repeat protein